VRKFQQLMTSGAAKKERIFLAAPAIINKQDHSRSFSSVLHLLSLTGLSFFNPISYLYSILSAWHDCLIPVEFLHE